MQIIDEISLPNCLLGTCKSAITQSIIQGSVHEKYDGQFAFVSEDENYWYLMRDRLGQNKLFYALDEIEQTLTVGNNLCRIVGGSGIDVFSVPAGHYLKVSKENSERRLCDYWNPGKTDAALDRFDLGEFQQSVEKKLHQTFEGVARLFRNETPIICLSGGLDSSIVARFAREHLPNLSAVTFSYAKKETIDRYASFCDDAEVLGANDPLLSDDLKHATRVAGALDIPFFAVLRPRELDPSILDEVLVETQDWRDFNVHCGWVNFCLAQEVARHFDPQQVVFLTGDLMNEFVADYAPVQYGGVEHYTQPKISRARLRHFLIRGLDAGDREIGVFNRFGFRTIQPFAAVVREYLTVPDEIVNRRDCKEMLNASLLAPELTRHLNTGKVRAQVGGSEGGTLGLFHDAGVDQRALSHRWHELIGYKARQEEVIFAGRYRCESALLERT